MNFIYGGKFLLYTLWEVFTINGFLILSSAFCASLETTTWFWCFSQLMWCDRLMELRVLKHPCISGINPRNHGVRSFSCIVEFSLLILEWGLLHVDQGYWRILWGVCVCVCVCVCVWFPCLVLVLGSRCPYGMNLETFHCLQFWD